MTDNMLSHREAAVFVARRRHIEGGKMDYEK
jgi:hypothetical protein